MKEFFKQLLKYFNGVKDFLSIRLFDIGNISLMLWTFIYFCSCLASFLHYYKTQKMDGLKVLSESKIELGVRLAVC